MHINRLKKVIKVFLIILAILLIIVIAIVGCALTTYHKQPVLTDEDKEELSVDNIWKTRTEPEMAEVIEDNGDALLERIKLISNAMRDAVQYDSQYDDGYTAFKAKSYFHLGDSFQDDFSQAAGRNHCGDHYHGQRHHDCLVYSRHYGWQCQR